MFLDCFQQQILKKMYMYVGENFWRQKRKVMSAENSGQHALDIDLHPR